MKIILGSNSPRRKEILSYFSLPFVQAASTFDESTFAFEGDPAAFVTEMAEKKAAALAHQFSDPILTADTVVFCHKKLYIKPENEQEALQMLMELSGHAASVFTGVCVRWKEKILSKAEESQIVFHKLTEKQIKKYHSVFDWKDRAGGFQVQKGGGIIIRQIKGDFYNIMGLPITTTRDLLLEIGIDLWDYLKS